METVKIDKLIPGGQGIGTLENGKKCLVWGALPGETVEIEVTRKKASYIEGIISKVLIANSQRIAPKDECYLATSPWQIMDYDYELQQKTELVEECFRQSGLAIDNISSPVTDGNDFLYRNKMEYALYWDNEKEKIFLAFHVRGTHRKLPIVSSSIERPEIFLEATRVISDLNIRREPARKYQSLMIRCDQSGEVRTALFENHKPHPILPPLKDTILGYKYSYSPTGFFQINLPIYELVLKEIESWIKTDKVLDFYSGVGTIGLSVARGRDLTLVETNGLAYKELVNNCKIAGPFAKPILAKSEDSTDFIKSDTTVILDPPRAGLDAKVILALKEALPPTIIYLSCNPITQARDISELVDAYDIELCRPYNFFPRTPHIENLVILVRK